MYIFASFSIFSSPWHCLLYLVSDNLKLKKNLYSSLWILVPMIGNIQSGYKIELLRLLLRASLVAQWLRIRLPVQGTQVRALVREDPTCCGATKPVHRNY